LLARELVSHRIGNARRRDANETVAWGARLDPDATHAIELFQCIERFRKIPRIAGCESFQNSPRSVLPAIVGDHDLVSQLRRIHRVADI
jgi:hypothetical protein